MFFHIKVTRYFTEGSLFCVAIMEYQDKNVDILFVKSKILKKISNLFTIYNYVESKELFTWGPNCQFLV